MKQVLMPLLLVVSLMTGCNQQETWPVAAQSGGIGNSPTASNTLTFAPADWTFEVYSKGNQPNPNKYQSTLQVNNPTAGLTLPVSATGLVGAPSRTASYSLGMTATTIRDTTSFCYWYSQLVPPATLRVGDLLTLKASIRVDQVRGRGVMLLIGDHKGAPITSLCGKESDQPRITGTADFTDYTFTLPYKKPVGYFRAYLFIQCQTIGTVTFRDVTIRVN